MVSQRLFCLPSYIKKVGKTFSPLEEFLLAFILLHAFLTRVHRSALFPQCFCGFADADFDKNGSLDEMDCDYLCTANPDQFCGGFNAIEVFQIGDPVEDDDSENPLIPVDDDTVPTNDDDVYTLLGCYADPDGSRSMFLKASTSAMTAAVRKK